MYGEHLDLSKPVEFESEEERLACISFFNAAYRAEESGKVGAHKLAEEVRHGFISPEAARRDYGVVLDPVTLALDEAATAAARNRRA